MVDTGIKKRRVSKKTKKSWRKHVDIQDVDRYLENSRLEERLGVPYASRKDEELFAVDKSPDRGVVLTKAERRAQLKNKEPKCFAVLKPITAVPDPITKRNRVRTPEERKSSFVKSKELKRKLNNELKYKERVKIQNRLFEEKKRAERTKRGDFSTDAWETQDWPFPELSKEWLRKDTVRHTLANLGKLRKQQPSNLFKKPSVLSAVETPHPGTSYNPSYEDHHALLTEVAEKEMKLIKEEEHLHRVTTGMFKKVTATEKDKNQLKELSEGLPLNKDEKVEDEIEEDEETALSDDRAKKANKKTLQHRRLIKEHKSRLLQQEREKMEKKKHSDIYKLKILKRKLEFQDKKQEIINRNKKKLKEIKALEPKVLGKNKYEPVDPDFQMSNELTGNLRSSKPVGNLLKDRFKSLQQRNMVTPSNLVLKRTRAKVKRFVKQDHRIDYEKELKKVANAKS